MNANKVVSNISKAQNSLAGRKIIITRAEKGNATLGHRLVRLGARTIELPAVQIVPPESWEEVDEAARELSSFDWVVFTSANGVSSFFERMLSTGQGYALEGVRTSHRPKFACVGPATACVLEEYGLECSFMPDKYLTERLAEDLVRKLEKGSRVLLARSEIANKEVDRILSSEGVSIQELTVYRALSSRSYKPSDMPEDATDIVFASPSAVGAFSDGKTVRYINSRRMSVHCIGPVTAKAAADCGLEIATVSNIHTTEGLVNAIISHVESSR